MRPVSFVLAAFVLAVAPDAIAQVKADALLLAADAQPVGAPFTAPGSSRIPLLVELPPGATAASLGLRRAGPRFGALDATEAEVRAFRAARPSVEMTWSPPRRTLLDRAAQWVRSTEYREQTGNGGAGAIVAIIDTGIDVAHPDFRDAEGNTRIAWMIDFSRPPAGFQPDLERRYGCEATSGACAVYSAEDIEAVVSDGVAGNEPTDTFGHGTHVASLAAGNGFTRRLRPIYVGPAPEADLIVARVTRGAANQIFDSDILTATDFVFDRAAAMGKPVVANLSLGSDFGPHDGTSSLERGLEAFVGAGRPGRAIVVAAGNSGSLFLGTGSDYPEPLGVHTEVHVPRSTRVRVPLITPRAEQKSKGTIYVWIGLRAGDRVSVGLDQEQGSWIDGIEPGDAKTFRRDGLKATIFNGSEDEHSPVPADSHGAAVILEGTWKSGTTYPIVLEGSGTAKLWVQTDAALTGGGSVTAFFPRATKEGTINVPASSPGLVAVGATVNRDEWTTANAQRVAIEDPPVDSIPFFSSAGPNARGVMKPDLVAPGVFLIGAMSNEADPRDVPGGVFDGSNVCQTQAQCLVVDSTHAVTSGTSMAAPIVAGAMALLFASDPTLTQDQARTLLQAGARRPSGNVPVEQQAGPGVLDLVGALDAMSSEDSPLRREPAAAESWLSASASYASPDPRAPVSFVLQLRDTEGRIADGFDARRLGLATTNALLVGGLERRAPGYWVFEIAAPEGSGQQSLRVRVTFDGETLAERVLSIGVDRWAANGSVTAKGGCSTTSGAARGGATALLVLALGFVRRRRAVRHLRRSRTRRPESRNRTTQAAGIASISSGTFGWSPANLDRCSHTALAGGFTTSTPPSCETSPRTPRMR